MSFTTSTMPANTTIGGVHQGSWVMGSVPFDKRTVVDYRSDLVNQNVWQIPSTIPGRSLDLRYTGMIVAVVNEDDDHLQDNGLYFLPWDGAKNAFRVVHDDSETQHDWGWIQFFSFGDTPVRIDKYTIKDNDDAASTTDNAELGLHVVRVDGGAID